MRLGIQQRSRLRPRHVLAPVLIAVTLALTACGGSSSKTSGTAASSSGTSAASAATTTEAAGVATSVATGAATAAATQAAPTPTAAPQPTKTAAPSSGGTSVPISPVSPMQQVADNWKNVKSYKMTMTIYDSTTNTQTGNATVETMLPDKSHWILDEKGRGIEIITIGSASYIKIGNTWAKVSTGQPTNLPAFSGTDITNDVATPAASPDLVSRKGTETLNGVSCDVYEVKTDSGSSTFWVGHNDHMLYKGSFISDGTRTEILFSDFNKDFNIQPPI